jgi:hypothetical protein
MKTPFCDIVFQIQSTNTIFLRQMFNRKDILRAHLGNNLDHFSPLQISASAITTEIQNQGPKIEDGADMDKAGF